ncbi:hypothetical protein ACIHEI_34160 [Kitasatospora sp. NPDC051984]|uniref:hypothetical protein n=1 Tax=Kitasatospora sp. NPDC051984 TaxID=3364059 RepID=UPI0037CC98AB
MHDPESPADANGADESADSPSGASYESAREVLRQVLAAYSERIVAERGRTPVDAALLHRLLTERRQARSDQQNLLEAGAVEVARVQEFYEARLSELLGP